MFRDAYAGKTHHLSRDVRRILERESIVQHLTNSFFRSKNHSMLRFLAQPTLAIEASFQRE